MTSKTIFIGDVNKSLSVIAKSHCADAWLLTLDNMDQFEKSSTVTVYTSVADLPKDLNQTWRVLCQADTIVYCPPQRWSDNKEYDCTEPTLSMRGLTETLLLLLPASIKIVGAEKIATIPDPVALVDQRRSDQPQLWIAGCSISHGVGVDKNTRYGAVLANALSLPCSFLTRGGSAIDWAADQIIRSDIRPDDLVVWGLTAWERVTYIDKHAYLHSMNIQSYKNQTKYKDSIPPESLFSHQTFFNHFYAIQRVINFCKKARAQLLLVGILPSNYALLTFLKSQHNYIHIDYTSQYNDSVLAINYLDLGTDNLHPGILQHQAYANSILDFIQNHPVANTN